MRPPLLDSSSFQIYQADSEEQPSQRAIVYFFVVRELYHVRQNYNAVVVFV